MHRPLSLMAALIGLAGPALAAGPALERVVIDDNFPGGYQVEVADVNGDGKPDVVALGGGTCAWYENPSWNKRIITGPDRTPGIISSATADLDGDGKAEVAIAYEFSMNEPTKGKLLLAAQGKDPDDPWEVAHVADVPSIHRLRWHPRLVPFVGPNSVRLVPAPSAREARARGQGIHGESLLVAPLFGPSARPPIFDQEPAHLMHFNFWIRAEEKPRPIPPGGNTAGGGGFAGGGGIGGGGGIVGSPSNPFLSPSPVPRVGQGFPSSFDSYGPPAPLLFGRWERPRPVKLQSGDSPVLHAVDLAVLNESNGVELLAASNLGVTHHYVAAIVGTAHYASEILVPGAPGEAPKKGASEVHVGKLKDGRKFLATVEPWHGTDVAVYLSESLKPRIKFGPRAVIDATLKEGHALWVADLDGDGDDEILAGYRGGEAGVNLYHREGEGWARSVVDANIAAQDLRGGDLDGDGRPDVVAIGGKTHNVVWYRPMRKP